MNDGDEDSVLHEGTRDVFQVIAQRTTQAEQEGRIILIDHHPQAEKDEHTSNDPDRFVGRRIYKEFLDVDGVSLGWFFGTITHFEVDIEDSDQVWYCVHYDDDDKEDYTWAELRLLLEHWECHKSKDVVWIKKQNQESSKKRKWLVHTPSRTKEDAAVLLTPPRTPVKVKKEKFRMGAAIVTPPTTKVKSPPPRFKTADFQTDVDWIQGMAQWLETSENLSMSNARTVLRQVTKLAKGQGVDYRHWPSYVVFLRGVRVDLTHDIDKLIIKARAYEDKFALDKGHGWLLKHPLKKMKLYQTYCGIRPTVSTFSLPESVSHVD